MFEDILRVMKCAIATVEVVICQQQSLSGNVQRVQRNRL